MPASLSLPAPPPGWRRLYLARHGETDWNLERRLQGRTDQPLNEMGVAQAHALATLLADEPISLVAASPLQRAATTAAAIQAHHPGARLVMEPSLVEMCFGELEGRRLDEVASLQKSVEEAWARGETEVAWPGPGGESIAEVARRGVEGLSRLVQLADSEGTADTAGHILVTAHGRFNRTVLAALRGDLSCCNTIPQGNACLNVLDVAPGWKTFKEVAIDLRHHLQGLRVLESGGAEIPQPRL